MANLHMCRNLHMNMFRCDLRGRQSWSMVRNRRTWRLQCTLRCYRARFEQGINCAYTCACVCECVCVFVCRYVYKGPFRPKSARISSLSWLISDSSFGSCSQLDLQTDSSLLETLPNLFLYCFEMPIHLKRERFVLFLFWCVFGLSS